MKTTIALLSLFAATTFSSGLHAQLTEGFENTSGLDYYTANGWQFYGAAANYTSQITAAGSIYVIPSTSTVNNNNANSNTTQVVTPFVNFANGGTISFNYKLTNDLGSNSSRTFTLRLMDAAGTITPLYTFTITSTTLGGIVQTSPTISVPLNTGNRRLIIDFTGHGTGNSAMYFDNLSLEPREISNIIPLPIKLLSFTGSLHHQKASLTWNVDANETGEYFEVQRSADGKSFTTAALLFTSEKPGVEDYQFTETLNKQAYYRLRIVNKDRSVNFSKVLCLKEQATDNAHSITVLQNPLRESLRFSFVATAKEPTTITLYNISGIAVFTTTLLAQQGANAVNYGLNDTLQKGTYVLEVRTVSERKTITVIK